MKMHKFVSRARLSAGAAPLVLGLAMIASPAWAQAAADAADDAGEIVVTGSRIATPTLDSASPLQIVDAQDIDNTGAPNLQNVLLENPAFGTPGISRTNSNFSTSSAGVATVDLRNLGSDRTLVLVDGRRFVAGIPGSATVDLNTIPAQFIERVDVLTGGASAVYGSDAVAGVVNIIYKKHYQGIELGGQVGISEEGDDLERQVNLTVGGNFADDRGNVIAYIGYTKQGAVFSRDRTRSAVDQISLGGGVTGQDADIFTVVSPFYSSFAPQGRIFVGPVATQSSQAQQFTFDANGNLVSGFSTNGTATRAANGFNRSAFRTIAIPTERYLFATRANYEINEHFNAFIEGTYASTKTTTELEPFPLDSSGNNGIFPATGGRFAIEGFSRNPTTGAQVLTVNPLVPAAIVAAATDTNNDGFRDIGFTRRLSDFGNRGATADRDTFRIVGGLTGAINDRLNYEAYYSYGQTRESQLSNGQVNLLNFRNALDVVQDVFDLNGNGSTTDAICRDQNARAQGCVPADVFNGAGKLSPAAVQYIRAPSTLTSFTRQSVAGANISGSVFDLPAGPLGVSVGGEYRREYSEQIFDALTNAGLNGGNALQNTKGSFDVYEGYGEVVVPIFKDQAFAKQLDLRAAGRVSHYSTVGTVYSYNYGVEYAPVSDIRFRVIRAQSTRAPNIGELFGGSGQTFPTGIVDPCVGVTLVSTTAQSANCRAAAGVLANINSNISVANPNGRFTLNQADVQGISGLNTSNPNLGEERGRSWTAGVVISPKSISFLRNFAFTVDYFDIKIAKAITSLPRNFILQQCYVQSDPTFCQFITRRAAAAGANSAGSLSFVNSTSNNSGGIRTSGLDVTGTFHEDLSNWGLDGDLTARVAWTYVFKGYTVPLPGAARDEFNREVGASRNKVTGNLGYKLGNASVSLTGRYIGPAYLDDQFSGYAPGSPEASQFYRIGSKIYTDMQVQFTPGDHIEVYVGADNLFNTSPPPVISGLPGDVTGTETDAGTYDAIGRRFYAGARIKF